MYVITGVEWVVQCVMCDVGVTCIGCMYGYLYLLSVLYRLRIGQYWCYKLLASAFNKGSVGAAFGKVIVLLGRLL